MRRYLATLAVAALAAVAACAPDVTSGTVVEKRYDDPDSWPTCTVRRTNGTCQVWGTYRDDEHWELRVSGVDADGEPAEGWVEVASGAYRDYRVGDAYP